MTLAHLRRKREVECERGRLRKRENMREIIGGSRIGSGAQLWRRRLWRRELYHWRMGLCKKGKGSHGGEGVEVLTALWRNEAAWGVGMEVQRCLS